MGLKKKNYGATTVAQESGSLRQVITSSQRNVVGVEFTKSNGTITSAKEPLVPPLMVALVRVVEGEDDGVDFTEKNCNNWKSFTQSKISDKRYELKFCGSEVVNGESIAKLDLKKYVDRKIENWTNALIVYVTGQNPNLMTITNYCKSQ